MNIQEDYVSFETAKLLKEKGFDEDVLTYYAFDPETKQYDFKQDDRWDNPHNYGTYYVSATTLQMAMKWLREVHNLHCDIGYDDLNWFWNIISVSDDIPVEDRPKLIKDGYAGLLKYEEACEAAIKYCLEHLI